MSGNLGGGKTAGTTVTRYTSLQVQTSAAGVGIPIGWGTNRTGTNLIWYGNFQSTGQSQGGKGGGGSSTSYTYSTAVAMAIGEGPIAGIGRVWASKDATTLAALNLTLMTGTAGQAVLSSLYSAHPDQALSYPLTAYVASPKYDLGSSPNLPNHNYEVMWRLRNAPNGQDANPADILLDFLTNPQYGMGLTTDQVSDLTSYRDYCTAAGLFLSPLLTDQNAASDTINRWGTLTNTAIFWSGGQLKAVPLGDMPLTGNGVTWTPNLTPVYDLNDDDFLADSSSDPVTLDRSDVADSNNIVQLEYLDRANAYQTAIATARDQSAIDAWGQRVADPTQGHDICDGTVAAIAAQLVLQRQLYIRNTYTFKLGWAYGLLEPGDIVTLTDSALGLAKFPVRITGIDEDADGTLTMTAEELPAGIGTATEYARPTTANTPLNTSVDPGSVAQALIMEPSPGLTGGVQQVWVGAVGVSNWWGGCHVWLSLDDETYQQIGSITAPCRIGTLATALPAASDPDTADTPQVTLASPRVQLLSGTQADADAGRTLALIGVEMVAYATATLTAPSTYSLSYLRRGLYGTPVAAHAAGTAFARLDEALFRYDLPAAYVGQRLYLKLTSYNLFGAAEQSLADVPAYTYTPVGAVGMLPPPTGLTLTQQSAIQVDGTVQLAIVASWTPGNGGAAADTVLRWQAAGGVWQSLRVPAGTTTATLAPVVQNVVYTVQAASSLGADVQSNWTPAQAITLVANLDNGGVSALTLDGQGSGGATFTGRDIKLVWTGSGPYPVGAQVSAGTGRSPYFAAYRVQVIDPATGGVVRTDTAASETYTYSYQMNQGDGGPRRTLTFAVAILDKTGGQTAATSITVTNPAPAAVVPHISQGIGTLIVDIPPVATPDLAGYLVWLSQTSGFDPINTTPAYDGPNPYVMLPATVGTYYIRVAAYDAFGKTGLNISAEQVFSLIDLVVDPIPPAVPTGLALSSTSVVAADGSVVTTLKATWNASPSANFASFDVAIQQGSGSAIVYTTTQPAYQWTVQANTSYTVEVRAWSKSTIASGWSPAVTATTVRDTIPPGPCAGLAVLSGVQALYLSWSNPTDTDLAGIEVWAASSNNLAAASRITQVLSTAFTHTGLPSGSTRYYWLRAVDTSGNLGPWYPASATAGIAGTVAALGPNDLAPGSVGLSAFATGLLPIQQVTSLPAAGTMGRVVYLTTDGQLYRDNGSTWTAAVPATSVSGQLTASQIQGVLASQVSGVLATASIPGLDASKIISGQFSGAQIAAGAITTANLATGLRPVETMTSLPAAGTVGRVVYLTTDGQLYRDNGSTWTAAVPATSVTGQLTSSQIQGVLANQVSGVLATASIPGLDASKIISGQFSGAQIAAGAITTANLATGLRPVETMTSLPAAGTVGRVVYLTTDGKLYRDNGTVWTRAVDGGDLTAGSVTANSIAAGTITAAQMAAGAVTATQLAVGSFDNLAVNGDLSSGTLDGWSRLAASAGDSIYVGQAWDGSCPSAHYLGIARGTSSSGELSIVNGTTSFDDTTLSGGISVQAGDQLYVEATVITSPTGIAGFDMVIRTSSTSASGIGGIPLANCTANGVVTATSVGGYTTVSMYFTAPARGKMYLRLWNRSTGPSNVDFFNVKIRRRNTGALIVDGSITSNQIAAGTIVASNIAAGTLTATQMAAGTLTAAQIQAGSLTGDRLAANTITGTNIAGGSITGNSIAAGSITGSNIAAGAITAALIAAGTITGAQIAAGTIVASNIAAGTLTATQMAAGTLTAAQIQAGSLTGDRLAANTITGANIAAGSITGNSIAAGSITGSNIAAGAITSALIAAGAVTATQLAVGSFDNLAVNGDLSSGTLDGWSRRVAAGGDSIVVAPAWDGNCPSAYRLTLSRSNGSSGELSIVNGTTSFDDITLSGGISVQAGDQLYVEATITTSASASLAFDMVLRSSATAGVGMPGQPLQNISGALSATSVGVYTTVSMYFTAPARGKAYLRLSQEPVAAGQVHVFNVKIRRRNTGALIVDGSITSNQIAAGTIIASNIAAGTLTATQMAAGTLTAAQIQAGSLTGDRLAANTITGANIAGGSITGNSIAAGSITGTNIAAGAITAALIAAGAVTATQLAVGSFDNLAVNGDLSSGTLDGWTRLIATGGDSVYVAPAWDGNCPSAYRLTLSRSNGSSGELSIVNGTTSFDDTTLSGGISVQAGDQLYVEATITTDPNVSVGFDVVLRSSASTLSSMPGTPLLNVTGSGTLAAASAGAYTTVAMYFTASVRGKAYLRLWHMSASPGQVHFFNIKIRRRNTGALIVDGSITGNQIAAGSISAAQIAAGTITAAQMAAGTITAAQIAAQTLTGSLFAPSTNLPATITVGATGVSIGTIQGWAANPAATINSSSTQIAPGMVQISGTTSLASWRNGGDTTKIEGGAIAANTITANKLTVGNRAVSFSGLAFTTDGQNTLSWSAGSALYVADNGATTQVAIAAGSLVGAGYVYWTQGAGSLSTTVTPALAMNDATIILCTYSGGAHFVANYGGVIIEGSSIRAGTITAAQIAAGAVTAQQMSVGALSAITSNLGTVTAGYLRSPDGRAVFDLNNARIVLSNGYMKVIGTGFGTTNQFIEWYGAAMDISACSEANAISFSTVDGRTYFGGALSAGTLTTSASTPDSSATAFAETAQFYSRGHKIVVTVSYSYSSVLSKIYANTSQGAAQFKGDAGLNNAVQNADGTYSTPPTVAGQTIIDLYRAVADGAYASAPCATLTVTDTWTWRGEPPVVGDSNGSSTGGDTASGSMTFTDPDLSTQDRQYKAVIRTRANAQYPENIRQTITVICVEQ